MSQLLSQLQEKNRENNNANNGHSSHGNASQNGTTSANLPNLGGVTNTITLPVPPKPASPVPENNGPVQPNESQAQLLQTLSKSLSSLGVTPQNLLTLLTHSGMNINILTQLVAKAHSIGWGFECIFRA